MYVYVGAVFLPPANRRLVRGIPTGIGSRAAKMPPLQSFTHVSGKLRG